MVRKEVRGSYEVRIGSYWFVSIPYNTIKYRTYDITSE